MPVCSNSLSYFAKYGHVVHGCTNPNPVKSISTKWNAKNIFLSKVKLEWIQKWKNWVNTYSQVMNKRFISKFLERYRQRKLSEEGRRVQLLKRRDNNNYDFDNNLRSSAHNGNYSSRKFS